MTTPAVLGERVLRRLGVEIVPVASRPVLATVVSVTSIAERALQGLGVPVAAAIRPPLATVVTPTAIAARALQALGVSVTDANRPAFLTTVPIADIAARALQGLGVTVTDANRPALATVVTMQSIADAALQAVGVTVPAALQPPVVGTSTATDIATNALIELGVIAADEIPSGTNPDWLLVVDKVGSVHAALVAQGIATWDATAVPTGVTEEYIKLTALVSASSFGKTADPSLWAALEARVRKYSQVKQSQGAEILARVASVHDSLVADGNASWLSTAIPQAAFDEYVALTTAQIAPVFAVAIDPATLPPISARVKRIALLLQSQGLAEDRVAAIHDELVAQAAVSWASTAIPQAASDDYVALTMQQMAPLFGVQAPDVDATAVMEKRVKRIALIMQGQTLAEARVATVHDELVGNGYASWALNAIPQAVADDYTALVELELAPVFEIKADPAEVPVLAARVKRFALVLQAQALAEARVNAIHDELVGSAHVSWAASAIPQAVSDDYVALTMIKLAPVFEIKADPNGIPAMEARIRHFSLVQAAPALATEAVIAVHADLAARGKVRWSIQDIPLAAELPYLLLAAFKLAPEFDKPANANDYTLAEKSIARLIALPTSGERVRADYF